MACLKLCFVIIFYALIYGRFADKVYCGQQGLQPCSPGTFLMQASLILSTGANYCHICLTFIFFAYLYYHIYEHLMSFVMLANDNGLTSLIFFFCFSLFGISPFLPPFSFLASVVDVAPEGFLSLAI